MGAEFQIFMHTPGPDHEARKIEGLRPTAREVADLPEAILEPWREHFGREVVWHTEEALHADIVDGADTGPGSGGLPNELWFLVCANWDVFANVGTLEP